MKLNYDTYEEACKNFKFSKRWEVFDGNKESLNIAHECIDRHPGEKEAIRIKFENGKSEIYNFKELSSLTAKLAHMLSKRGVSSGDPVALFLQPSPEFYVSFFGTLKRGAAVVPCFPLFGPEAIEYRINKSNARMIIVAEEKLSIIKKDLVSQVIVAEELLEMIKGEEDYYKVNTSTNDLAVIQFSSGTTGVPKAIPYKHVAATMTAVNMKLRIGLHDDHNYFCPSSPAWGHGIWFGTVGPLIFGNAIGSYSGRFSPEVFLQALEQFNITTLSATPLVYRMVMNCGKLDGYRLKLQNMSYTGGRLDLETIQYFQDKLGIVIRSLYGSTEVGGVLTDFPFEDFKNKPGSMGKPMIGVKVAVLDENDNELPPGQVGQLASWRNGRWIKMGDAAYVDEEGYFWYKDRIDDIIISAGYTIGPFEVEKVLEKHPAVKRAAVVGSPDRERGEIVKAFIVTGAEPGEDLANDIKNFIKEYLSKHEYPREIEFLEELPETPDGKIKRKQLREQEKARKGIL